LLRPACLLAALGESLAKRDVGASRSVVT